MANVPLDGCINTSAAECLNQDNRYPVSNLFQPNENLVLKSDVSVDPQLLVSISFQSPVKLSEIVIRAPADSDEAPQDIKIFVNKIHLGFDDVETEKPAHTLSLGQEEWLTGENRISLRLAKFQNVNSVQLFFEANQGGEVTTIKDIKFFGQTAENMNMADFKPIKS